MSKKSAKKKSAAKKSAPLTTPIFYRECDGRGIYRVLAPSILEAAGGGWDLSSVPEGAVEKWDADAEWWEPAELPPVGRGEGMVRHTKNAARIGA